MKRYLINILTFAYLVSLISCSVNSRELTEEEIEISENLKSRFESSSALVFGGDTLLASKDVLAFYKSKDYQPIWIGTTDLNKKGTEMLQLIAKARDYGLMPEMFGYKLIRQMKDTALLDAEMMLTNAFFLFTTHVDVGCVDPETYEYVWKKDSLDYSLEAELERVIDGEKVEDVIASHEPDFWDYHQLKAGLGKFLDENVLDTNEFEIPAFKDDSVKCYKAAHLALLGHHYIDSSVTNKDTTFIEALKEFQRLNGLLDDAIVGKWTGKALSKSNLDRYYRAALSLEKWRWKKEYPEQYIRVNIPEFKLYYVDSNEVKRKHRVVVGAPITETPEFQATLRTLVTNPFWHVPYSIASTEILHGARKDSAYFNKRGYQVFKNGEVVNPKEINWSDVREGNFGYRIRQDGGGGNSLGRIKFLFPNEHSVFLHDTPSKSLFANDVRAYSHGCVRLHNPFDLARAILIADDKAIVADSLDSITRRGIQKVIELANPFEVYLEYFTATGDSSGNVIFHADIYGRDEKFIERSFKKFETIKHYKNVPQPAKNEENTTVASNS